MKKEKKYTFITKELTKEWKHIDDDVFARLSDDGAIEIGEGII